MIRISTKWEKRFWFVFFLSRSLIEYRCIDFHWMPLGLRHDNLYWYGRSTNLIKKHSFAFRLSCNARYNFLMNYSSARIVRPCLDLAHLHWWRFDKRRRKRNERSRLDVRRREKNRNNHLLFFCYQAALSGLTNGTNTICSNDKTNGISLNDMFQHTHSCFQV